MILIITIATKTTLPPTRREKRRTRPGTSTDTYTGEKFAANDKKNLDQIIAAHEIHNDPGRILAECDGADLG